MELTEAQLGLVTVARARQPGALRELAIILDDQLADEDACLDGAVAAWQAVGGRRTRSRTIWARAWAGQRGRRRGGAREMAATAQHSDHADTARDRRPAA